jgi:3-deoxy-D-manno-octulosonic-acid transferase
VLKRRSGAVKGSILFRAYRLATASLGALAPFYLDWRQRRGKEDPLRLAERMGQAGAARPQGRLVWLHAATIDEATLFFPLIENFAAQGFKVLVSTGPMGSASSGTPHLPARTLHQFVPLDLPQFMGAFLDHWRPDLMLLAGSEIRPNLIVETARHNIPLALIDARIGARSFLRWRKIPRFAIRLMGQLDFCLARTKADAERFKALGARRVQVAGNLLYDCVPPRASPLVLAEFKGRLGARPVWIAATTFRRDEDMAIAAHRALKKHFPNLATIIVPSRVERGATIARRAAEFGLTAKLRTQDRAGTDVPDVYLVDTIGEAGLFYRLAEVIFFGHSLPGESARKRGAALEPGWSPRENALNPVVAAKLGCAILHGPDTGRFADIYADIYKELAVTGGAAMVGDADALAKNLALLLHDAAELRDMARAAAETVERRGGATNRIMRAIAPHIAQAMVERRVQGRVQES